MLRSGKKINICGQYKIFKYALLKSPTLRTTGHDKMLDHVKTNLSCKTVAFKMSFGHVPERVENQREKIKKTQSKWIEYRFRTHYENSISANDKCDGNFEKWNEIKHMAQTAIQGKKRVLKEKNMHLLKIQTRITDDSPVSTFVHWRLCFVPVYLYQLIFILLSITNDLTVNETLWC